MRARCVVRVYVHVQLMCEDVVVVVVVDIVVVFNFVHVHYLLAYLCGHIHTLGGRFDALYSKRHGFFELELGDFARHHKFRVFAFDHDLFSFVDTINGSWPVILITNPKVFLVF